MNTSRSERVNFLTHTAAYLLPVAHRAQRQAWCSWQVRQKALVLADIQAFVQRRQEEDEHRKNDIEDLEGEMEQ